jgi:hypothetical protein
MQILGAFHARKPSSRSHPRGRSWSKKGSVKSTTPKVRSHSAPSKPVAAPHTSSSDEEEEKSDSFYINIILADNWPAWQEALKILPAERVREIEEAARYYLAIQKYVNAWDCYDDCYDEEDEEDEETEAMRAYEERFMKPSFEERRAQRMMDAEW